MKVGNWRWRILQQRHIILPNERYINMILLLCFNLFLLTACNLNETNMEQLIDKGYQISSVELPFDDTKTYYIDSTTHDDVLEIFLVNEENEIKWYVFDMSTETWEDKDFVWNHYDERYIYGAKIKYDTDGNRYALWKDCKNESEGYNIYKMNDDGTMECYVKLSDYIPDYKDISPGWKFMEDGRILAAIEYESGTKARGNVIIDVVKREMQETLMESVFIMENVVIDGDLYMFPTEYDNHQLCVRVGDLWDVKRKQLIQSGVKGNSDDSPRTLPLFKEEEKVFHF